MSTLNQVQTETLRSIIATLHPSIEPEEHTDDLELFKYSIDTQPIVDHIVRRLNDCPPSDLANFKRCLGLLQSRMFCLAFSGIATPFQKMNLHQRVRMLQRLRDSRIGGLRRFFQSIKRITLFVAYAMPDDENENPAWKAIGYFNQNPITRPALDDQIAPFSIPLDESIDCDVLVIGSGAGGSVVAAHAANAGRDVVIVEKARWIPSGELGAGEIAGNRSCFEKHGALATRDLNFVVLAGSSVGGGTTINWMTSLDLPDAVRNQWAQEFGLSQFASASFDESMNSVKKRLNVNINESNYNAQNQKLYDGCQRLGFGVQTIPRNALNCQECDFCNYGCRAGAKQDTRQTYLGDAIKSGARIYDRVDIKKLVIKNGNACGAIGTASGQFGERPIRINCKRVVVAAGAIHSPAILMRSGVHLDHIGKNLHLHPTTAIVAYHEDKIESWRGAPQTVLCDHFSEMENSYGVRLEVAPVHPGFAAMGVAWRDPVHHKRMMQQMGHFSTVIVLARDINSGAIKLDSNQNAEIHYRPGKIEKRFLIEGSIQALRIQLAAGAHRLMGPHQTPVTFSRHDPIERDGFHDFDKFIERIRTLGGRSNSLSLFSAHQMSTCRMATSPKRGVVDPDGKVFGIKNLYVADASVFPTASGVNPMLTIMATADLISRRLFS